MRRRTFLSRSLALATLGLPAQDDFDAVLAGGTVVDGTGAMRRRADVGLRGARIASVGDLAAASTRARVDVSGLTLSPGFIDVHTHSEDELLTNPKAESKIRQGVTTEILGMDGGSYAPDEFAEKLAALERAGIALNAGSFVGQGTLRGAVMGMSDRPATDAEIDRMKVLARTALDAGAFGISSGLEYTPGGFASGEEIGRLCTVMRGSSGLYATHLRNEDDRVVEAVDEAIAIASAGGVGLHVSHLKCQGARNYDKLDEVFAAFDRAEAAGISVTLDRYPYIAYSTGLSNLMPLWSREGGTDKFIERLRHPEAWLRIREAMADKIALLGSWDAVMISSVTLPDHEALQGKTVAQIVEASGGDPFETTRELIIAENNRVGIVGFGMSEENTARILAHPKCMPASDGSALAVEGPLSAGSPHPRSYGTFARVLGKYVREMKSMSLEEAIRKMTSLPADRFGLAERGRLTPGYFADIVAFDPDVVIDRASFARPHQYADGFEGVWVNGRRVLDSGERLDALPGKVLRGAG